MKRRAHEDSPLVESNSESNLSLNKQPKHTIEQEEDKYYVVEEDENLKVISKQSMDDTDLLVSIYNSLVLSYNSLVTLQ